MIIAIRGWRPARLALHLPVRLASIFDEDFTQFRGSSLSSAGIVLQSLSPVSATFDRAPYKRRHCLDICKSCKSTITERYFRVRNEITCSACAKVVAEEAGRDPTPFILKGIVFAFIAACIGALLRAGFEGVMGLAGSAGGLIGMFLRWFVLIAIAGLVVRAAKAGAKGRGGALLQVPSVIFFYLAVTLAFVPVILLRYPNLPRNLSTLWVVTVISLKAPFTSMMQNPINITGLIAILICMAGVWSGNCTCCGSGRRPV